MNHISHLGTICFLLIVSMIDALSFIECGGDLNAPSGTISSPNYPNLYPHNRLCRWKITVPQGRRVTFTFNDLRLEDHDSCAFDYVEVRAFNIHLLEELLKMIHCLGASQSSACYFCLM